MDQAARWRAGWRPDDDISIPRNAHWLKDLREQHPWQGKGLIVLSMFDGIGGAWQALKDLGIPVLRGYSCEVDDFANAVVKARFPEVIHLGSVTAVTRESIPEQVDLIVGGFPCQDLSFMGNQRGLHGSRSGLFFHIPRLISLFQAKWFLVENVKCRWQDQAEVSKYLQGVLPIELDAEELSPQSRKRYYWTNLPLPPNLPGIKDAPETALDHFVKGAVVPVAKINTILTTNNAANTSRVALQCVYDVALGRARYVTVDEVEVMMGYPRNYSKIAYVEKSKLSVSKRQTPSKQKKEHVTGRQLFAEESAEPPQKKLKLEDTPAVEKEAQPQREINGSDESSKEKRVDGKVFINLSSDEDEEKAEGEAAFKDCQEELGSASEEDESEVPHVNANESDLCKDPARIVPEETLRESLQNEAGGSGLSNEEKANEGGETKSPGYSFRARKAVDYNVDHQFGETKYQVVARRRSTPRSTPRRTRASLDPQEFSQKRLKELRWICLGNSFVVPCIAYMLSPLLNTAMRERAERITSIPAPAEKDACLFEAGEIWALYNDEVAPNWYAQISSVKVTCPKWDGRTKIPPKITASYFFYEFPAANEANPEVGTGVLELSKTPREDDVQKTFSHRMEPLSLEGGRILVSPKKGDVWVVKDKHIPRFKMHVYIVDSNVDKSAGNFECTIRDLRLQPRSTNSCTFYRIVVVERQHEERFHLCHSNMVPIFPSTILLSFKRMAGHEKRSASQRTKTDCWFSKLSFSIHRMVGPERLVRSGESVFSYQVPYFYKNEAGLLYVEPQTDTSQSRMRRQAMMGEDEPALAEEEELALGNETEARVEATPELARDLIPSAPSGLPAPSSLNPQPTEANQELEQEFLPDTSKPSSSKGKEKLEASCEVLEGVAGILPASGSYYVEQRPAVRWEYVHQLMESLPILPPLLHPWQLTGDPRP